MIKQEELHFLEDIYLEKKGVVKYKVKTLYIVHLLSRLQYTHHRRELSKQKIDRSSLFLKMTVSLRSMAGTTRSDRCKINAIRKNLGIKCSILELIQKKN